MKKILFIFLMVILASCGGSRQQDESLTGTWRLSENGLRIYQFNDDGTGYRSFDANDTETFTWFTRDSVLHIERDRRDDYARNEEWTYSIGDTLTINNLGADLQQEYFFESHEHNDVLFGIWRWDGFGGFFYVFNEDGTGLRKYSDEDEHFTWSTTGTRVGFTVKRDGAELYHDRCDFSIRDGVLTITHSANDLVYSYIFDSEQQDAALVGEWIWDEDETFVFIFNEDGTGTRGYTDETEDFIWSTTNNNLVIHTPDGVLFNLIWERWSYNTDNDTLTIDNQEIEDLVYVYTRN